MQTRPHPEPFSSIGFARENPEPQFFSTLDMDDGPEIQPACIPDLFAAEIALMAVVNPTKDGTLPRIMATLQSLQHRRDIHAGLL